jgi:C4-dicarboxylate-binding protein DctP
VQKYVRVSDHGYLGYAVIVNKKFWEGLPADVRGQLEKAMVESTDYANRIAKEENDQSLEAVRKTGKTEVFTPTKEERAALRARLVPLHKEMASRIGAELIEQIHKETGFKP